MAKTRFCFTGVVNVDLMAPIKWEDREIKTIALDFSKANAKAVNWCESATLQSGNVSKILPQYSSEYCSRFASCISDLPYPDNWEARYRIIHRMGYEDFDALWQTASAFMQKRDPQKFYDRFVKPDYDAEADAYADAYGGEGGGESPQGGEAGFTPPAGKPGKQNTPAS